MHKRGITACGCYLPVARLERSLIYNAHAWALPGLRGKSKGKLSVASWDQDSNTMAVEAARNCLDQADKSQLTHVTLASTSQPFKERSGATLIGAALGLSTTVFSADLAASRRAGTTALLQSLLADNEGQQLITAADKRIARPGSWAEIGWGDGAAALLTDQQNIAAELVGWHSHNDDYIDFYWADGFNPYQGEERWIKDTALKQQVLPTVNSALKMAGLAPEEINWSVLCEPVAGCEKAISNALNLVNATPITQQILALAGDLGTALPFVGLSLALESAEVGDHILVTGFGSGCDALIFKLKQPIKAPRCSTSGMLEKHVDISYTNFATSRGIIDLDYGPRSERVEKTALSVNQRVRRDFTSFIGGRAGKGKSVQFPKSPIANDGTLMSSDLYEDVRLADLEGRIVSITTDHLTYTPQPPFYFGLVDFDNGVRLTMEFTDVGKQGIEVGDRVRMQFRIKSIDSERGYRHYFWKASPLEMQEQS